MKNKLITLMTVVSVILLVLCGCASNQENSQKVPESTAVKNVLQTTAVQTAVVSETSVTTSTTLKPLDKITSFTGITSFSFTRPTMPDIRELIDKGELTPWNGERTHSETETETVTEVSENEN